MKLSQAKRNERIIVEAVNNPEMFVQSTRFGIEAGSILEVVQKIHKGPIIVRKNQVELAIGYELSESILVTPLDKDRSDNAGN